MHARARVTFCPVRERVYACTHLQTHTHTPLPLPHSVSLLHSLTHSDSLSNLSLSHTHTLPLSVPLTPSLSHSLTHSITHYTPARTHTLTRERGTARENGTWRQKSYTHSLSPAPFLSRPRALSLFLSLSFLHTQILHGSLGRGDKDSTSRGSVRLLQSHL